MQSYTEDFYKYVQEGTQKSAMEIVPFVLQMVAPQSVIDVGCGTGIWLSVFQQYGIKDILGIDGDYINKKDLKISEDRFLASDLRAPLKINRTFDLVVSLEVAEHLPKECAPTFVDSLTQLGSVILFSAAIPFQGGTEHINEQWLDYWANLFEQKGYVAIDSIRKRVWENENVEFWYAQNILIFVKRDCLTLPRYALLKTEFELNNASQLAIVHPKKYQQVIEKYLSEAQVAQWYIAESQKYKAEIDSRDASIRRSLKCLLNVIKSKLKKWVFKES